ncbi:MAG: PD40 domain-containing protein [Thermoleophilia bacterium]|nr:PD40 domain-containing protein [Thermoleophilia bacterium]
MIAAPLDGRRAERELTLVSLRGRSEAVVLGAALGEVAWSPDGEWLAWCGPDGSVSMRIDGSAEPVRPAGCRPRFAPDGTVITRADDSPAPSLLGDGRVLLAAARLEQPLVALGSELAEVAGFAVGLDGTLAVAVLGRTAGAPPPTLLELWRDGVLRDAIRIPAFSPPAGPGLSGLRVELSPDGNEAAILFPDALASPGPGTLVALVDLRTRAVLLSEEAVGDVAWSPDSAWLAVAGGREVAVYGTDRSHPVYRLPVVARSLAWRAGG